MRGSFPPWSAVKALAEETVHEPGHRDAMTFGFMEERRDDGSRDDGNVMVRLWHQLYMPRGRGLLQTLGGAGFGFEPWEEATAENQFAPSLIWWNLSPDSMTSGR